MDLNPGRLAEDFIQLARIALSGRPQDVQLLIHRASKRYHNDFPEMTNALLALLKESPSRSSPLRKQNDTPLPVDLDSRLQLLRIELNGPEAKPILSEKGSTILNQVLSERKKSSALLKLGLEPTKSMLFTGPPGVGKTLSAKWIASELKRPLLVLDLAAVMSSYLGRTGNNIRYVLDYAKSIECVLLLDELDAIAKRRDDAGEIGELKRLVTVLLQEIDDWPSTGLLIAATNHPDLLDPAIWRRFEVVLDFNNPDRNQIEFMLKRLLETQIQDLDIWSKVLSYVFSNKSYSEIERQITHVRKMSVIANTPIIEQLKLLVTGNSLLTKEERYDLAVLLDIHGIVSQRRAYEITGISRDTIRKRRQITSSTQKPVKKRVAKTATTKRQKI